MTDITVEGLLKHYGVKGMKWGVRRKNTGGPVSPEAAAAAKARQKAKESGVQSLSNKEMQALVTRMSLEKQLKNVTPASRKQQGAKFVGNMLVNVGKQQTQMLINDQVNKQIKRALGA
jgi:hypothetical protein